MKLSFSVVWTLFINCINLFIPHIHYYRQNVQLNTYIIRMARSYMATLRGWGGGALKVCLK